ncbi:MAG: hypothetical protein HY927_09500 [Elusimicrobia bacterium]|nr:hypothetical protein [Elusimicrobiota bacterium]
MSPDGEGSVLVESGGFRIDRDRALDKLKRFQLPEPARFVLPLIRCAVASGATSVEIETGGYQSSPAAIRFDGRPFTKEELADPCSVLFEEALPENARNRDLATALLTALRFAEGSSGLVSVSSGEGTGRFQVRLNSPIPDKPPSFEARDERRTIVLLRAAFEASLVSRFWQVRPLLVESLRECPIPVELDGVDIPRGSGLDPEWSVLFDEGGVSGWLGVPLDLGGLSSIAAYKHGVAAGSLVHSIPRAQVEGWINDDLFTLNASQTGIVCNERFERAMALAAPHVEKLVMKVVKDCRERLEDAARPALSSGLSGFLRDCLDRGSRAGTPGLFGSLYRPVTAVLKGSDAPDLVAIRRASRCAAWLLDACERSLTDFDRDQANPVSRALWKAPLFLGAGGEPLSIMDIRALSRRMGFLPVSKSPMPRSRLPFVTVWLASDRHERVLRDLVPADWKDMTDAAQASEALVRGGPGGEPAPEARDLARFGYANLLVRDVMPFGPGRIEVGIPDGAPGERARIYVFEGSGPRLLEGTQTLGFAAVVSGMDDGAGPGPPSAELCSAATDCASWLYQRLASEYRPGDPGRRSQAIMLHLLRFLAWAAREASCAGAGWAGRLPESRRWAEGLRLFKTGSAWLDYGELRARFDRGEVLRVRASWADLEPAETARSIMGSAYTKDLLKAILPDAGLLDLGETQQTFLAFKRTPSNACEHKSRLGCLAAVDELGVHLTVDEYESGERLALRWGTVTAFGPGAGAPGLEEKLAAEESAGLELAAAVVERFGTLWDHPESTCRHFLLRALMGLCSPWPGSLRPGTRLAEFLSVLPMFRSGLGAGLTWEAVSRKLAMQGEVSYALCGPEGASVVADLALDDLELETVRSMWPQSAGKLKPIDAPPSEPAVTEPDGQDRAGAGPWCPSTNAVDDAPALSGPHGPPGTGEWRTDAPAGPGAAAIFSGRYLSEGLEAMVWIDGSGLDCLQLFMAEPGQEPVRTLRVGLPLVGAATLLRPGKRLGQAPSDQALIRLFAAFYADLIRTWPLAPLGDPRHEAAARVVLRVLVMNGHPYDSAGAARELGDALRGMWALKLFGTLGSGMASMWDLQRACARDGVLPYSLDAGPAPVPPEDSWIPILREPERILVETLLSRDGRVRLEPYGPAGLPARALASVRQAAAVESASSEAPEFAVLRRLLAHARGTRGAKLLPDKVRWAGGKRAARACLADPGATGETIVLSRSHPMVKAVADSGLDAAAQGLYLASIVFTRFNDLKTDVTDGDDARFHEAMAELLAREGEP